MVGVALRLGGGGGGGGGGGEVLLLEPSAGIPALGALDAMPAISLLNEASIVTSGCFFRLTIIKGVYLGKLTLRVYVGWPVSGCMVHSYGFASRAS